MINWIALLFGIVLVALLAYSMAKIASKSDHSMEENYIRYIEHDTICDRCKYSSDCDVITYIQMGDTKEHIIGARITDCTRKGEAI